MGAVCAAGSGVAAGCAAVYEGKDCLTPLSIFESGLKSAPLSGQIINLQDNYKSPNRTIALACIAAGEALSAIKNWQGLSCGLVFATTVGGITRSELFYKAYKADANTASRAAQELAYHEPCAASGFLCEKFGLQGFFTLSTACSSGLHAVGMAKRLVEQNVFDACLAMGADALSLLTIRGFSSLMLIDPTGCKPFDRRRAGTSLGEGAAAMLVASEKTAEALGAAPLGYISGWGASADCHHMTAPHPTGAGAQKAVSAALAEAGLVAKDIDMIASHGTATPDNDRSEIAAMRAVFGDLPPFFSLKRTLGHTLAASGILEAVFALCALRDGIVPPTAGFEEADDDIGAAPGVFQKKPLRRVLKNSFGFGGNNAAAVFSLSRVAEAP
jgi:3-oxoacyl-[acyl-carrier-protein] synthase-1